MGDHSCSDRGETVTEVFEAKSNSQEQMAFATLSDGTLCRFDFVRSRP